MGRLIACALAVCTVCDAGPARPLPKPYLALFTFQNAQVDQLTDPQARMLRQSPFDGMAIWLQDPYASAPPPALTAVLPQLKRFHAVAEKDLWPFVFLNRILQEQPNGHRHDPALTRIRGMDLNNGAGALADFLLQWRRALQIARALGSPGVGVDPEFYSNYPLADIATLAARRGESEAETRVKLAAVGAQMADIVQQEYPGVVIWTLAVGFGSVRNVALGTSAASQSEPSAAVTSGVLLTGLLERSKQAGIPLTVIDGSENAVGYQHWSIQEISARLLTQTLNDKAWLTRYPQLVMGATIAPWLDTQHRAPWMTDTSAIRGVKQFQPLIAFLLAHRAFVWVYGANTAYDVWDQTYADRFDPMLRGAIADAQLHPADSDTSVAPAPPPAHVLTSTGVVLADFGKPNARTRITTTLSPPSAPQLAVTLRAERHDQDAAQFIGTLTISAWPGGPLWQWPGISIPVGVHRDWRAYRGLALEVANPESYEETIGFVLHDSAGHAWSQYFQIPSGGAGVLFVRTDEIAGSVDPGSIDKVSLVARRPPRPLTLYLSPLVLVR